MKEKKGTSQGKPELATQIESVNKTNIQIGTIEVQVDKKQNSAATQDQGDNKQGQPANHEGKNSTQKTRVEEHNLHVA